MVIKENLPLGWKIFNEKSKENSSVAGKTKDTITPNQSWAKELWSR